MFTEDYLQVHRKTKNSGCLRLVDLQPRILESGLSASVGSLRGQVNEMRPSPARRVTSEKWAVFA
jgi:hypothetical protein